MPPTVRKKTPRLAKAPRAPRQAKAKLAEPAGRVALPHKPADYVAAVGRRKTAVARVRLAPAETSEFTVNGKALQDYFSHAVLREIAVAPLKAAGKAEGLSCRVKVYGGGSHGQAEAIRHGVARALLKIETGLRPTLKPLGFLTRDPRMKERKKPGLHRARRAPQWAKR